MLNMGFVVATETLQVAALKRPLQLIQLTNPAGLTVTLSNLGAGLWSVLMPDLVPESGSAEKTELLQNYQDPGHFARNPYYFAVTIGRVANRIGAAAYMQQGKVLSLLANEGPNQLHGGPDGLGSRFWSFDIDQQNDRVSVTFRITSPEGDQGFPGQLDVQLHYTLLAHHELVLEYSAVSDRDTPVSLTNHAYWAIGGVGKGTVLEQQLQLDADFILALDKQLIPTGELVPAVGAFDFKAGKRIGQDISLLENGYDHYFVLNKDRDLSRPAALVRDPVSGRTLQLFTDQSGIQFYSGNFLDGSILGNQGRPIEKYAALCLEPHGYPNAVNKANFPTALLKAGQLYRQCSRFVLGYS
ncbi:aldose epimerase family protein [Rheinheimera sp. KL1]|uniref:aldose epimerase family protein n=1 Tax=Rheinheimera sp. KL1 TaxID=1635005 RepID=UPI0009EC2F3A|nr:aldose epimerase family protein [Rheinheimera sp. KL1]